MGGWGGGGRWVDAGGMGGEGRVCVMFAFSDICV